VKTVEYIGYGKPIPGYYNPNPLGTNCYLYDCGCGISLDFSTKKVGQRTFCHNCKKDVTVVRQTWGTKYNT